LTAPAGGRPVGPNVRRLIVAKMSRDAVPPGGGLADAVRFLASGGLGEAAARAQAWAFGAVDAVRASPGWAGRGDEEIAGEILRRADAKGARGPGGP